MLTAFVVSDLTRIGRNVDGEDILAASFYLVVEAPNGARETHDFCFLDAKVQGADEDGFAVILSDEQAEAKAQALCAKVQAHLDRGGALDQAHWTPCDPRYGSKAYIAMDNEGFFRYQELRAAQDAGEHVPMELLAACPCAAH
jgi:hypothetical protein